MRISDWSSDVCSSDLIHTYEDVPHTPAHQANRAIVMGEYGGIGLPVEGHIWRPGKKNWGYQVATGEQDYLARFRRKMDEVIRQAKEEGLSASVYTHTPDVEEESKIGRGSSRDRGCQDV